MELTSVIKEYVSKRVSNLDKIVSKMETADMEVVAYFEVARNTNHHKTGDIFHANCRLDINGKEFYSSADKEDLYQAIDEVK